MSPRKIGGTAGSSASVIILWAYEEFAPIVQHVMRNAMRPDVQTQIVPGVVDVVVLSAVERAGTRSAAEPWRILTLQRGAGTRCTGAWEIVHGRIEAGERPEDAAVRETLEETGLEVLKLYNITVNAFYLHKASTVQLAIVFAAVVNGEVKVRLGSEHSASRWHTFTGAARKLAWPREREALLHVKQLLRTGDAGAVEDVLRVF
ncbi:MAG: NUDIX domain-containing protein [Gemmatimonadaceae bacterium]